MSGPSHDNGWEIDLDSYVLFSNDPLDVPAPSEAFWRSRWNHEAGHWLRYQSTSIGRFLTLIGRAQGITAQRTLACLPASHRHAVFATRAGSAIWSFDEGFNPELAGDHFAVQGQAWLDLEFARQMLFDSEIAAGIGWDPRAAFNSAISDGWRAYTVQGSPAHPGNEVADHLLVDEPYQLEHRGTILTTKSIWECASTIDELQFGHPEEVSELDRTELRWLGNHKLRGPVYGLPWILANDYSGAPASGRMLQVVAYISCNPILPFLDSDVRPVAWDEIYPPSRFLRLYELISETRRFRELDATDVDVAELVEDLATTAQMSMANLNVPAMAPTRETLLSIPPGIAQPVVGHHNYVLRTAMYLTNFLTEHQFARLVAPSLPDVHPFVAQADLQRLLLWGAAGTVPLLKFEDHLYWSNLLVESDLREYFVKACDEYGLLRSVIRGTEFEAINIGDRTNENGAATVPLTLDEMLDGGLLAW